LIKLRKLQYIFPFEQQAIPYVIAVNPGDYFIEKIIFGEKRKEKKISSSFSKPFFSVEAGKAYYIGDYEAETGVDFYIIASRLNWRLKKVTNNYASTTKQIESQIPFLKNIPKVNFFGDALPKLPNL